MKTVVTRAHVLIFRAVKGAVLNAAHSHPAWGLNRTMARSIAKRATGTLTSAWGDVLAARGSAPSKRAREVGVAPHWPPRRLLKMAAGGGDRARRSPPIHPIIRDLGIMVAEARRAGNAERERALVDVLRLIARARKL